MTRARLAPAVHFRVEFGPAAAVGPGKIALLEHIATGGSLSQAARELGMSYRRAWLLLASLNTSFRQPAALLAKGGRGGGGARLTPFGKMLILAYREFDEQVQTRAAGSFRAIASLATGAPRSARSPATAPPSKRGRSGPIQRRAAAR